jgi:hypothetical protein
MNKICMTTLWQILYATNNSQGWQSLECKIASMSHAMNTNGKMCIICVDLFSDTNFGALEFTYPINRKTKQFLKYKSQI